MREILFRGKRVDNGEWIFGWYIKYSYSGWQLKATIIPSEQAENGWYEHIRVIPETVGQYTGARDDDGDRIFEGDILHLAYDNEKIKGVVVWDVNELKFTTPDVNDAFWENCESLKIVGNIHDNPDLMEEPV